MGNLHSVESALIHVGAERVVVSSDINEIRNADRVIFPGVGGMRDCMAEICRLGFDKLVSELILDRPVLAICVGMQALMNYSQENGGVRCLDLFDGEVRFFDNTLLDAKGDRIKVPHMGWNRVHQKIDHPLWHRIDDGARFYFVHSYYVSAQSRDLVAANCKYGTTFDAALSEGPLFATQFHPEKSHTAGLQLLSNFISWNGEV
tara:strand:- start:1039 stop:1650 length:612 start_codon:yes stop_codon:yes gene_type:complete